MQILNDVTVLAKKFMIDQGQMLMGYSSSKGSKYFWRTVMSNPYIENSDVDHEMELTKKYCEMAFTQIMADKAKKQSKNGEEKKKG